jgi:hypothetical protein
MKEKMKPIESEEGWLKICKRWAIKRGGYDHHAQADFTLAKWFSLSPETLQEWKAFKAKLLDFDAIQLPPDPPSSEHIRRYYLFKSGALGLLAMNPGPLSPFTSIGWEEIRQGVEEILRDCPLLNQLASDYADHQTHRSAKRRKVNDQ